jgi:hypothetical protein
MPVPPGVRNWKPQREVQPRPYDPTPQDAVDLATGEITPGDSRPANIRLAEQVRDTQADEALRSTGKKSPSRAVTQRRRELTLIALGQLAEGYTPAEIAENMGVNPATVTGWFTRFRYDVKKFDVDAMLDKLAVPLASQNLIHGLLAGDKDFTLETLKGRGQFRRYGEQQGTLKHEIPPLVVKFEFPTPSALPAAPDAQPPGAIVGTRAVPRALAPKPDVPDIVEGAIVGQLEPAKS